MLRPIPLALAACIVLAGLIALTLIDADRARRFSRWLLPAWVAVILAVTLLGGSDGTGEENLYPGRTISEQLTNFEHAGGLFNVLGNVAMFVPVGWLVALLVRRHRLLIAAAAGFGLAATIEVVQSFIARVADVDDVILNGIGAVIGAGIAMLIHGAARRGADRDARAVG